MEGERYCLCICMWWFCFLFLLTTDFLWEVSKKDFLPRVDANNRAWPSTTFERVDDLFLGDGDLGTNGRDICKSNLGLASSKSKRRSLKRKLKRIANQAKALYNDFACEEPTLDDAGTKDQMYTFLCTRFRVIWIGTSTSSE